MPRSRGTILLAVLGLLAVAVLGLSSKAPAGSTQTPTTITLFPRSATNVVGTQHCVTATVKDQFGGPISGTPVTFTVSGAHSAQGTFPTNVNGQATACYTGQNVGNDTIRATAGNVSATASKTWVAAVAGISLVPNTATNIVGTQHCVTATVSDSNSAPLSGRSVSFQVSGANSAQGSGTTGANGQVTACYTGQNAGDDTITAVSGNLSATAAKHWVLPPASVSLTPTTTSNTVGNLYCVAVTVLDANGAPVSGIGVSFQVSGANSAQSSQATDANGHAAFCYTAENVGTDTITVTSGGRTATASKTWVPRAENPTLGKTVKIGVVSGTIRFREPGEQRFHVLGPSQLIPIGSSIDSTKGKVRLFAAKKGGGVQKTVFFDGRFRVRQSKRKTLVLLNLEGGNPAACPRGKPRAAAGSHRVLRRLWGHGKGRTRTSGNNGSGTVRGTFWLTEDRCDGTFWKVRQGVVVVRDFTLHRTVVLHAGQHYLAPAP